MRTKWRTRQTANFCVLFFLQVREVLLCYIFGKSLNFRGLRIIRRVPTAKQLTVYTCLRLRQSWPKNVINTTNLGLKQKLSAFDGLS
ncbi:hypothetical protein Nepgr_011648 [Nepenthes gracilis]|uniref:Uncharacterized protein n=1 Tax=Nepenthes gracilis TaxID=150966 RepID=A0AAD3XM54_NEPGR|nr:hypothetical protein Nepgr_011648 [Nepenthes gracilis]